MNAQTAHTANFNKLYSEFYFSILNFVTSKVNGKREIAEEITQDTFLKVAEHLQDYDSTRGKISTWIYNIAGNKVIDYYRRNKSSYMVSVDGFVNDEGEPSFEFKDTQKADELVNSDETMSAIDRAMDILNKKEMKIAELYFIDQMKYKEIAEQMELNLGTVKANINRIRVKLQNKLSKVYE
jgi:RNA polymerase sigma-70 factor (ECF subfamily)